MTATAGESRDPLDLLADEFLRRLRSGEAITVAAFAAAHPEHEAALGDLLPTLLVLEQAKRERESSSGLRAHVAGLSLQRLGDYRIVREVGRGGMGVVFEAVQESLDRRVALKVMPQASLLSGNRLQRFRREAQVAAQLHHTHIVPVFGSGEADGYHYYAMQFIDGHGLDAEIALRRTQRESAPAAVRQRCCFAARLGADVALALHHAHQQGTLHRDVKPANLLLDVTGQVWVTDFGLAKALQQDGLTLSGDVLGTVQYMAPEQFEGRYDVRSEVYALGATLYELIALAPAFRSDNRSELIERIRAGRCDRLSRVVPQVPRDLETIVLRAMALDPGDRYASAAGLAADLEAFLDDRPIAARRQSAAERCLRWCRRNRAVAFAGVVAIAATVLTAIVGWGAYLVTDAAKERAEQSATHAQREAARRASTLQLALQAFEDVFDTLVGPDPLHAVIQDLDEDGQAAIGLRAPVDAAHVALLQRMLAFYDEFAAQNEDSAGLGEQAARASQRVGAIQAAFGDLDAAVAAYGKAIRLLRDVTSRDVTRDLAALQQELGQVLIRRGQPAEADACFRSALRLLESDHADGSRSARWLRARGHFLVATVHDFRLGRPGGPGSPARPGRELRSPQQPQPPARERPAERPLERLAEAVAHLDQAQQLLAELLREQPDEPEYRFLQARCLLAGPRRDPQRIVEGLQILGDLVAKHPEIGSYRFELCEAQLQLLRLRGNEARIDTAALVHHAQALVTQAPGHPEYRALLGRCTSLHGERTGRRDRTLGERLLREALALELQLVAGHGNREGRFVEQVVATRLRLGRLLLEDGREAEARTEVRQVLALLKEQSDRGMAWPWLRDTPARRDLFLLLERLGLGEELRELRAVLERRR